MNSEETNRENLREYIVVGRCCEAGDILTPTPGDPEGLAPRMLPSDVEIGDLAVIDGVGAYCASMGTKNYNSFPEVTEVLLRLDGTVEVIRSGQTLEQILENEIL